MREGEQEEEDGSDDDDDEEEGDDEGEEEMDEDELQALLADAGDDYVGNRIKAAKAGEGEEQGEDGAEEGQKKDKKRSAASEASRLEAAERRRREQEEREAKRDAELEERKEVVYANAANPAQVRASARRASSLSSALHSALAPSLPAVLTDIVCSQSKAEGVRWCFLPQLQPLEQHAEQKSSNSTGTKFGGAPFLSQKFKWPKCNECGKHMDFLFQLNGGDLPEDLRGEHVEEGQLFQFFVCDVDTYEDSTSDKRTSCARLISLSDAGEPLTISTTNTTAANITADDNKDNAALSALIAASKERRLVGWTRKADVPDWNDRVRYGLPDSLSYEDTEDLHPVDKDKLSGFPVWVQDSEYLVCLKCDQEMEHFFQVVSEDSFDYMFGDCGVMIILQCPKHRDQLRVSFQCG